MYAYMNICIYIYICIFMYISDYLFDDDHSVTTASAFVRFFSVHFFTLS